MNNTTHALVRRQGAYDRSRGGEAPGDTLPPRETLEERVDRQRVEIMQAQAIVESVVAAMDPASWPEGKPGFPFALRAVVTTLNRVAEQLDPAEFFDLPGVGPEAQS